MKIFGMHYRFVLGAVCCALMLSACATKTLEGPKNDGLSGTENLDKQKRAAIRMQLAIDYYQQGQQKVALEEIKQALISSPDMVDAYNVRGLIFMDMGEKQLAEDNFLYALKLAPNNADVAQNYGWFLCQNGRERQAMPYFEQALKDPKYTGVGKTLNTAGICSLKLKDGAGAERYFMMAFRADPGNPSVNVNIARMQYERGDYEKAHFYIERMVKAEVLTPEVLWLAIRIENKRGDQVSVSSLSTQLRRRYPDSKEYDLLQRGVFNE
ncbi:type IV pilus biogenesis/stability protein PilW [Undibacterium sp.]|uniref:type IV pilus biogenesis/stability protein PilW n=1 Tax=Undibacterium sp. TaxID=1914977 RepID=UPI002CD56154|nr:type IV pilus biogenesis/stability protein PilW [Undibacterium sp.]HTD02368.1 type IV pilus biogenesis/stability protein PilW [Undibacterium sp.]